MKLIDITKAYNFKTNSELITSSGTIINVNLESFLNLNYEVIINLLPDEAEYSRENESEDFAKLGIDYVYIPINWETPNSSDYDAFETALIKATGKKVHIHCAANYRATAFYAIFAHKNKGWSTEKIKEFIGSTWQISEYPAWEKFVKKNNALI